MNAAQLFTRCLENEGVEYVFALPGEELQDLMFALNDASPQLVITRHEQGAAFMADVYGRVTGRAGVCMATLGPGATNLITGVADANLDHAPLVAITAQGSLERLHKESHQIINIVNIFDPITKWNTRLSSPKIIPESVRKAFKLAEMEKPGATHLELPEDIAGLPAEGTPIRREKIRRAAPDYKAFQAAADLITASKKPIILAGNGAIRKLASNQLTEFVNNTHIPVISTFMGKGALSDRSPSALLSLGLGSPKEIFSVLDSADLVITIGYDIAELDPAKWNRNGKKILHIDFTSAEVYDRYQPTVEVVADISNTLWHFNQAITKTFSFPEADQYRSFLEKNVLTFADEHYPLHPKHTLAQLRKAMDDDAIIISDVGAHKMWVGAYFPAYKRGTVIISNGFASMGIALPGAIGAKLASPDTPVVALAGDGSFLMNVQELETATRLGLDFTVIIFNDQSYSLIESKFTSKTGRTVGTDFTNPDFQLLARSFHCHYLRPESARDLDSLYREALSKKGITIIDLPIDRSKNAELFTSG